MKTEKELKLRMLPDVYYVWVGGSCDYGRPERAGGGAYILQRNGETLDTYVLSELHTTEFRMMLRVMAHALEVIPKGGEVVFLTNVAYLQNFNQAPTEKTANADLIELCREKVLNHRFVTVKIVNYHKYRPLPETHALAHEAMVRVRLEKS